MKQNQRGVGSGNAAKPDALGNAADSCGFHCCDAAWYDVTIDIREWKRVNATGGQENEEEGKGDAESQARHWTSRIRPNFPLFDTRLGAAKSASPATTGTGWIKAKRQKCEKTHPLIPEANFSGRTAPARQHRELEVEGRDA